MQNDFKYEQTLSIRQYRMIVQNATIRIGLWEKLSDESTKKFFIVREESIIRYCNNMIELIQSQQN